jgi:hypothetical protein
MVNVLLYSIIQFASGFSPNLTVLLVLRSFYGVAMGGEWGVGASLTMESIPPHARGFISGLLQSGLQPPGYTLPAGQYRLRMDSLNYDGSIPLPDGGSGPGHSHKGYAVRVLDAAGNPCAACSLGAWDDMCIYTPISVPAGGSFTIPEFSVPPDYAGQTVTIDIFDPGDISGGGNVDLYILDPSGAVARPIPPATVAVYDLGASRSTTPGTLVTAPLADPTQAFVEATTGGGTHFNGHWVHFEVPIPTTYNPGANPNNWYWSVKYLITAGVTATDTITVAIGLKGNPAHLLIS